MLRNYIKVAWRNLKKQPFFTFINTFGLAIGMAGGLLIALFVYDEFSYDTMFPEAHRIHRIDSDVKFGGNQFKMAEVSAPMAETMLKDFPQVEATVRFRDRGSMLIRKNGTETNSKELHATFVDSTFFSMFGIGLLAGDVNTALKETNTLVLTRSAAEKHFGVQNALGQQLILNNSDTYTVTGVIEDLPANSFLRNHSVFLAMAGYEDSRIPDWGSNNYFTFIKLVPSAGISEIETQLQSLFSRYLIPWAQESFPGITEASFLASGNHVYYSTMPLRDIHLYSNMDSELSPNSSMQNVYILSFIALFLILLASVNFMNLSTAQSLKRAKEVGIRKTLGSDKKALLTQFLTESGMITLISLLFAIGIAFLVLPLFNELSGKSMTLPVAEPYFWILVFSFTFFLGLLSGLYPAFFMSRFVPVKVLSGTGATASSGGGIRNVLVVFQFAISILLIIGTLVVYQQLQFIQSKDLGFKKDRIVMVDDIPRNPSQAASLKEEVARLASVEDVTLSSYYPTPSSRSNSSFFKEGYQDQENAINMQMWEVDYDYINTLDIALASGRDFDRRYATDSLGILLNESAVGILGESTESVLGIKISSDLGEENPVFYTVIGVVKDFHFESLRDHIGALGLLPGVTGGSLAVKIKGNNFSETLTGIERIWDKAMPDQPFNYQFMEEAFNTTYQAEQRLGRIFMVFTILSLVVACLGLFGLAAFNAAKRTKEIGIRKVLGAGVGQITYQLTFDFLRMVIIAIVISLPIGWYAMNKWLEDFTYRIDVSWWVLLLSAMIAMGIAILTVSYQSIRAAIVNPVRSLRTE